MKKITCYRVNIRGDEIFWFCLKKGSFGRKRLCWNWKTEMRKAFWAESTGPQCDRQVEERDAFRVCTRFKGKMVGG